MSEVSYGNYTWKNTFGKRVVGVLVVSNRIPLPDFLPDFFCFLEKGFVPRVRNSVFSLRKCRRFTVTVVVMEKLHIRKNGEGE